MRISTCGGTPLYEGGENDLRELIESAVRANAYLSGANLRGAHLGGANLRGADLDGANLGEAYLGGANLSDAYLGWANLRGADLGGANLGDADLGDAYLSGANLRGANFRGTDLGGADAIDAGQDQRGYRFVAIRMPVPDTLMIAAGCRWLTLAEARAHWGVGSKSTNAAECLAKVELIAGEAARRGWFGACPEAGDGR